MHDRERACINYICEGNCRLGREGTFRNKCQTCNKYCPIPGSKPKRTDTRNKRKERINNKEFRRGDY